jgi:hypothetical protein
MVTRTHQLAVPVREQASASPDAVALLTVQNEAATAAREAGAGAIHVRWEAQVKMAGGTRTAQEWHPGAPVPPRTVALVCVAYGWTGSAA